MGVHYADYHFESERFTRIEQRFTIHGLPTLENGDEYDGGLFGIFIKVLLMIILDFILGYKL